VKKLLVIEEVEKETKQKKTLQLNLVYHPVSNNKKNKINNKYFIKRLEKKSSYYSALLPNTIRVDCERATRQSAE
jgi:inner membrane protein involved in colicin E2 resistance